MIVHPQPVGILAQLLGSCGETAEREATLQALHTCIGADTLHNVMLVIEMPGSLQASGQQHTATQGSNQGMSRRTAELVACHSLLCLDRGPASPAQAILAVSCQH